MFDHINMQKSNTRARAHRNK